jgi:hypothetical protein
MRCSAALVRTAFSVRPSLRPITRLEADNPSRCVAAGERAKLTDLSRRPRPTRITSRLRHGMPPSLHELHWCRSTRQARRANDDFFGSATRRIIWLAQVKRVGFTGSVPCWVRAATVEWGHQWSPAVTDGPEKPQVAGRSTQAAGMMLSTARLKSPLVAMKSPHPGTDQRAAGRPPPRARASFMRNDSPSVTTTVAWCSSRSSRETAVVCSGRKRPHWSKGQWEPMPRARCS